MKYKIYTLASKIINTDLINSQKKVMNHLGIDIEYITDFSYPSIHNELLNNSDSDVIGFIDSDFIPFSKEGVIRDINYAFKNNTFIGVAHPVPGAGYNCERVNIEPINLDGNNKNFRMYQNVCTPYFFINKMCYEKLGRPTFSSTDKSDIGGEITYEAHNLGITYRLYYPTCFERISETDLYGKVLRRLGNYGFYGVGMVYPNVGYHLLESRFGKNVELFANRCNDIINNTFSTDGFYDCQDVDICEKLGLTEKQINY